MKFSIILGGFMKYPEVLSHPESSFLILSLDTIFHSLRTSAFPVIGL